MRIRATPKFMQESEKAMTQEALQDLIDTLTLHPEKGVVLQGTGGIRKIRWRTGKDAKGKSGGVRVLYYFDKKGLLVLLITLFKKSIKDNISAGEKSQLKKLLPELLRGYSHE